jgi:hypothetical protein
MLPVGGFFRDLPVEQAFAAKGDKMTAPSQ